MKVAIEDVRSRAALIVGTEHRFTMSKKVAVLGLDSVPPEILFEKLLDKLPNFKRIYREGLDRKSVV